MTELAARTLRRIAWMLVVLADVLINWALFRTVRTVSATAAEARDAGRPWGCALCRWLDSIDPGHCDAARADPKGPLD